MRVLLIEDDELLGRGLRTGLAQSGFLVDWVRDGEAGLLEIRSLVHQVVVLDLGLPRRTGMDVLRQTRAQGIRTPVIIVTAQDQIDQKLVGLNEGADDYIVKPVDLLELSARLHAVIRRTYGHSSNVLQAMGVALDAQSRRVTCDGAEVILSTREFSLLHALLIAKGRVQSREQLEQSLYQWGQEVESNTIEVHIHHLRKKLKPELISTVRGLGYIIQNTESS